MEPRSEQLEREAEEARWQLSGTLEELRGRLTPGRVIDQVIDHAREGPAAEFLRNLGRELRENPMPLVLIGIGIAWLMVASSRSSRVLIADTADSIVRTAADVGAAASVAVSRASGWGQQTVARVADQASDLAISVGTKTAELAGQARHMADSSAGDGIGRPDRAKEEDPALAVFCEEEAGNLRRIENLRAEATAREPR